MNNKNQVGPVEIINRGSYYCAQCNYLDNKLIHSGLNPKREFSCKHPELENDNNYIGNSTITPNWCPYLKEKNNKGGE